MYCIFWKTILPDDLAKPWITFNANIYKITAQVSYGMDKIWLRLGLVIVKNGTVR